MMTVKVEIEILRTPSAMQEWSRSKRLYGRTIGVVPTMGALHEGHLSLLRKSSSECDETIVTIFVNPLQFGPSEDFNKYPRDEGTDLMMAADAGATVAYCPGVEAMYREGSSIYVIEDEMSKVLCGKSRPAHFGGVLTVVAKLFNATLPDRAYFGKKDYQQMLLIRKMADELDFPLEIVPCPVVRESDGLAMSSRNKYLSETQRLDALCLKAGIENAKMKFEDGERNPREIESAAREMIDGIKSARIDYIECRDAETLADIDLIEKPAVLALAVFIGDTRLIDNTVLIPSEGGI
jgi:pantoate--beta-alanine ligase